jgi:hypothetical protein
MEYKSKRHQEFIEDFMKNHPIVLCLHGEGRECDYQCSGFYNCWVKKLDEKDKLNDITKKF